VTRIISDQENGISLFGRRDPETSDKLIINLRFIIHYIRTLCIIPARRDWKLALTRFRRSAESIEKEAAISRKHKNAGGKRRVVSNGRDNEREGRPPRERRGGGRYGRIAKRRATAVSR